MAMSGQRTDREHAKFVETSTGDTAVRVINSSTDPVTVKGVPFSTASNTTPSITNASSVILAANANRKYAYIFNNNGFTAYLKLGGTAVVNQGIALGPNDIYEITSDKLWTGSISAIKSTAAAAPLDVFEGT